MVRGRRPTTTAGHFKVLLVMQAVSIVLLALFDLNGVKRGRGFPVAGMSGVERGQAVISPYFVYDIVVHRTGVGLLFTDPQFGQQFEYSLGLDFQFSSQLVNSNLHRSALFALRYPRSGTPVRFQCAHLTSPLSNG